MLAQLTIRDIVLVDRLVLHFDSGLTALTGETGAGKSILLDALALALGGRGDGLVVRHGETQGQVTAVFDVPFDHPAWTYARDQGVEPEGSLILRRVQLADGRTRAYLNDAPVSAQTLRDLSRRLVEIHGQHADRALLDPSAHRALLDAYAALDGQVKAVREAFAARREAGRRFAEEDARLHKAREQADFLHHVHDELMRLKPQRGEEAELAERRNGMMQAEKVAGDLNDAAESLGGEGSPVPTLAALMRRLERRAVQAPALIEPSLKALDIALIALDQARTTVEGALKQAAFDPRELEAVEERLFALRAAARKHGTAADELPALVETFAGQIAELDAGEATLAELAGAAAAAERAYRTAAETLSQARKAGAKRLDAAVNKELVPLKLDRARFITEIDTDAATGDPDAARGGPDAARGGPDGIDRVEFWVATNPGTRPGPLTKVASGGELSRFMLALKVSLASRGSAPTLVFDEIDAGVGGAVADAIGVRLVRLAERVQVLAVTHAPQVAARSANHMRISKAALKGEDRVATRVTLLEPESRREEIARMLAGATITEEARAAARRLMQADS